MALPYIVLSRKASPTNDIWQGHVNELMGFVQIFLNDLCVCHASIWLSPPVLHLGHARWLQEEQVSQHTWWQELFSFRGATVRCSEDTL